MLQLVGFFFSQTLKAEGDAEMWKEQIRKVEQEIEKLKTENRTITEQEEKTRDALSKEINRAHLLQKELEETKTESEELESKSFSLPSFSFF